MGLSKEYHVWDVKYIKLCKGVTVTKEQSINNELLTLRFLMQNNDGFYESYFDALLSDHITLTGDITPSYSGLKDTHLIDIKKRLEHIGFDIKVVFLMRDPFERC